MKLIVYYVVIASEAKQSSFLAATKKEWIASSQELLAMTAICVQDGVEPSFWILWVPRASETCLVSM